MRLGLYLFGYIREPDMSFNENHQEKRSQHVC